VTDGPGGELAAAQREHWSRTYANHPGMYGQQPSQPARYAADVFAAAAAQRAPAQPGQAQPVPTQRVLELGAGHGRDALYFAARGLSVIAADFSAEALAQLEQSAIAQGVADRVRVLEHDVRDPLPLADASVDAVFAHMLLCMALSTEQIHALVSEVRRVLHPGGTFVYTVRHTGDAHHGTGIDRGGGIYEHGGFAVHFFDRALVDDLATGWNLVELHAFEEGDLPRRLWRVTQTALP
jgi:SAM-dependent methyltransferase